jgi:hypothetical protein
MHPDNLNRDAAPGRLCPAQYGYARDAFAGAPVGRADTVYVAGGLYGNLEALDVVEAMAQRDQRDGQRVAIVFNGDFHWFDAEPGWFAAVNDRVLRWTPTLGNVEAELAAPSPAAGCGCGYPEHVGDSFVAESNRIMAQLDAAAPADERQRLAPLPKTLAIEVGGERIVAVHGDTESLAGWQFAAEHLPPDDTPLRRRLGLDTSTPLATLQNAFRKTGARILVSAHTCLPCACRLTAAGASRALFNNGAAGMPNFRGTCYGIATRISAIAKPPVESLYGFELGRLRCDAVALHYDQAAWTARFLSRWPAGSSAHINYFERLCRGPGYDRDEALRDYREQTESAHASPA